MALFRILQDGVVQNVIVADIEFMRANYPAGNYELVDEPVLPEIAQPRIITKLAFLRRFTVDEEIDLELASLDVPTGQPAARRAAARVRVAIRRLLSANRVDLDDAEVVSTMQQFEDAGLLAAGRAEAILSAPVQYGERVGA